MVEVVVCCSLTADGLCTMMREATRRSRASVLDRQWAAGRDALDRHRRARFVHNCRLFGYRITQRVAARFASNDHCLGAGNVFSKCAVCCGYGRGGLCESLARPEAADGQQRCAKCCHFCVHINGFVAESSPGFAFRTLAESLTRKKAPKGRREDRGDASSRS